MSRNVNPVVVVSTIDGKTVEGNVYIVRESDSTTDRKLGVQKKKKPIKASFVPKSAFNEVIRR